VTDPRDLQDRHPHCLADRSRSDKAASAFDAFVPALYRRYG